MKNKCKKHILIVLLIFISLVFMVLGALGIVFIAQQTSSEYDDNRNVEFHYDDSAIVKKDGISYLIIKKDGKWYETVSNKKEDTLRIIGNIEEKLYYLNENKIQYIDVTKSNLKEKTIKKFKKGKISETFVVNDTIYIFAEDNNKYSFYYINLKDVFKRVKKITDKGGKNVIVSSDKIYYISNDSNRILYEYDINKKTNAKVENNICSIFNYQDVIYMAKKKVFSDDCSQEMNLYKLENKKAVKLVTGRLFKGYGVEIYYFKNNTFYSLEYDESFEIYKFNGDYDIKDYDVIGDNTYIFNTNKGKILFKNQEIYTHNIDKQIKKVPKHYKVNMKNGKLETITVLVDDYVE